MAEQWAYGGQAVLEGVMMRGRRGMAVAVRLPSDTIAVWYEPIALSHWQLRVRRLPLVRGVFVLWDTLVLGIRALVFSAQALARAELGQGAAETSSQGENIRPWLWVTVAISLAFSLALFFLLPLGLVSLVDRWISSALVSNLIEGMIRLGILLLYLVLIARTPDVRRVFRYHGAEHKTIHAYEAHVPLEPENVRPFSLLHPRCGTGFLLIVMLIAVLVFALLGRPPLFWRVVSRIALVPVIAALAYEFIKWTASQYHHRVVRWLTWPSMALQRLTTAEPDRSMLEVAIAALETVLYYDGQQSFAPVLHHVVLVDALGVPLEEKVADAASVSAQRG
ncbi:MAG: DUF1385 domain-containing protein [Thermorudis peleae]|nr:DUF1385 domain-containing protein [Thermorudis peleae]